MAHFETDEYRMVFVSIGGKKNYSQWVCDKDTRWPPGTNSFKYHVSWQIALANGTTTENEKYIVQRRRKGKITNIISRDANIEPWLKKILAENKN